jgi:hypothetical protein
MGRKTVHQIGNKNGVLEVIDIIPSRGKGTHVGLKCICHNCKSIKIISGVHFKKRNSCGCLQHASDSWKHKGPKTMPWQLPNGQASKNNLQYQYRTGALKRGLSYELDKKYFETIVVSPCVYCGDSLGNTKAGQGKTSGDFKYTGIDRINSSMGYTVENTVPCCWNCNSMKNNMSVENFINHIKKILTHMEVITGELNESSLNNF